MSSLAPYSEKGYLRRSMSTRTIRRGSRTPRSSLCSEPFDMDEAKHQATVAATLAMRRSAERSSTDSRRSYDSIGGPSSMAVPRRYHRSNYTQDPGDYSPARKSISREVEPQDNDQISLAALPSISEFGGLDGRNASLPSSYRRLRKSRSMFAPRQRLSHISCANSQPEDESEQGLGSPLSRRTLRRSMSFLRGNRSSHPIRHARSHEAVIQLARAEFDQKNFAHDGRSRHSSLFTLKPRRDYRPFRKTFRSTSASGVDPYEAPSSAERYRSTPSFGRARSFSSSIKRGIRRVLGWNISKPPCDPAKLQTSPCQSFDQENRSPGSMHLHYGTKLGNEAETTQSHAFRHRQSFESLATSSSRVTSWADSTVANTITTRRPAEQSLLSIIHERTTSGQDSYPPASTDYLQRKLPSTPSPSKGSPPIDSQRLYTALVRKIGGFSARGSEEEIVFGRVKEHRAVPTRASSLYPRSSKQTIRHVPSDESFVSRRSFTTARASIVTPQGSRAMFEKKMDEDDTGSIIFATPEGLKASSDTSSVYSRSISGNSPTDKEKTANMGLPGPEDEPGVATIFESKRTTYSSPNRVARSPGDMPIRPSVDWQQWMNTQMQRIDKGATVRDHYREVAQLHREETDLAHDSQDSSEPRIKDQDHSAPAPVGEDSHSTLSTNNNFSRPFSRSSSVRSVNLSRKELENKAVPSSTSASPNYAESNTFSVNRTRPKSNAITLSPIHSKPNHRFPPPESPTPKRSLAAIQPRLTMKLRYGTQTVQLSPDGRALSLRSARSYRDITKRTNENIKTEDRPGDYKDLYMKSQQNNSPMSSKRLVELFLDSRRRRMGTETSEGGGSEDAFV